ncbi:MAG: hemerythrin [Betaproteobacteria bacterium]|nr:hemerythrin [Betaproteobacteria bacterium]NBY05676.1 hemerythrin [Betaproteobacteria bacterium]
MNSPHTTTEDFEWTDKFILGYRPMDDMHQEFVEVVSKMLQASDKELAGALDEFAQHAKVHFDLENQLMEETQFPPRDCHIDEHAAVMKSVTEVIALVREGQFEIGRSLIAELVHWFPSHTDHLDSALAHWMCKRSLGGKPVVLRRNLKLR